MPLDDIHERYGTYLDALSDAYQKHLSGIVEKAQATTIARFQRDLKITDGVLDSVPSNLRLLRQFDDIFEQAMDEAGYPQLVEAFVDHFPGQLRFMQEIIADINETIKRKLVPTKLSATTKAILNSFQVNAAQSLDTLVAKTGAQTMRKALFSVGAMKFRDLVEIIGKTFNRTVAESVTLAATSQSTFFRVATLSQFKEAQKDQDAPLRYQYAGPIDLLIRPFCLRMMEQTASGRSWTMDEISDMDNDSDLPVDTFCGGWNCRHSWLLSLDDVVGGEAVAA